MLEDNKNLVEFFEEHGEEGFLDLFLTNYLFELVQYFLHSRSNGKDDTSIAYYFDFEGKKFSQESLDKLEVGIRRECSRKAKEIVQKLKELSILEKIVNKPLDSPEVADLVKQNLEEILKSVLSD